MALVITSEPAGELLSLEEAKRHLRLFDDSLDAEIADLIRASRDYCERFTQRTLRTTTTRTLTLDKWWPTGVGTVPRAIGCNGNYATPGQKLPWPPLIAVSSIAYYDADNASQTLSSSNYIVELSTNGGGRIVWTSTATIPAHYCRPDAITITFTAGYVGSDSSVLPPVAVQAMKTKLTELFADGTDNEIKAASSAADRLLAMVDWTGYA